jgi:hypothetical protein
MQSLTLAARIWRRYDLAVTTQAGDRPTFLAVIAGRKRAGPVERRLIGRIKQFMLNRHVPMGEGVHRVTTCCRWRACSGSSPSRRLSVRARRRDRICCPPDPMR